MKEGDTLNYEIWKAVLHEVNEDEYAYKLTDKIISLIEKRINSIPSKHDSNTVEEVNYTNGWNHALYEVKKEILK